MSAYCAEDKDRSYVRYRVRRGESRALPLSLICAQCEEPFTADRVACWHLQRGYKVYCEKHRDTVALVAFCGICRALNPTAGFQCSLTGCPEKFLLLEQSHAIKLIEDSHVEPLTVSEWKSFLAVAERTGLLVGNYAVIELSEIRLRANG